MKFMLIYFLSVSLFGSLNATSFQDMANKRQGDGSPEQILFKPQTLDVNNAVESPKKTPQEKGSTNKQEKIRWATSIKGILKR